MIIQHTQFVTHKDSAAKAYATPHISQLGSVRDVTSGSGSAVPPGKGGNANEGSPGVSLKVFP